MRASVLIVLVILSLSTFLYFSSQLENEMYKEEFAHAKCRKAMVLDIPKAFLHSNTYQTSVFYSSKTKTIDFNQTKITGLPDDFFENTNCIEQLVIDNNMLTTIPKTIQQLQNLRYLDLSQNKIRKIPKGFFSSFENLSTVDLNKNNLKIIHLDKAKLQGLELNNNYLQQLIIKDSTSINNLYLSNNELRAFPKEILKIKNLYTLDLHSNSMNNFSSLRNNPLVTQSTLETLILNYNPIEKFPTEFRGFPNLSSIDFGSCKLQGTVKVDGFPSLNLLEITSQKITRLILKENNLSSIRLMNNRIREVIIEGPEAGQQIIMLNLSSNPLKEIPDAFKNLLNLSELDLKNTQLTNVDNFDQLPFKSTLTRLDLSFNELKTYPDLSDYPELITIDFSYNQLTELPILNNTKQKRLNLSSNPITYLYINEIDASIEELILNNNGIEKITGNEIKENLKTLDLSFNPELKYLDIDILKLLPNLKSLKLYDTRIENQKQIKEYCKKNDVIVKFTNKVM